MNTFHQLLFLNQLISNFIWIWESGFYMHIVIRYVCSFKCTYMLACFFHLCLSFWLCNYSIHGCFAFWKTFAPCVCHGICVSFIPEAYLMGWWWFSWFFLQLAATTLTSWHLVVTFCSLHVAKMLKLFEHEPFDPRTVVGFGILNGISIGLLNLCLGFNSVGFYQVNFFWISGF